MPIADRTTRQMNHSFHVIAARIVVITPRKFVLQMIKLDSLFVVCRYVRAQFSSFPLEGGDWGKLTKGQGVMFYVVLMKPNGEGLVHLSFNYYHKSVKFRLDKAC